MSSLADRIEVFMAVRPGGEFLAEEIAKAVRGRRATVYDTLKRDERFASRERAAFPRDRARVYRLDSNAATAAGTASPGRQASHCARLLSILRDGRWHSSKELNDAVPCRLNSRMAEIRSRGKRTGDYRIEHEQEGAGCGLEFHRYRLVWLERQPAAACVVTIPYRARSGVALALPPAGDGCRSSDSKPLRRVA